MLVRFQPPESMRESRAMRYARPLGWAALAAAPILLSALGLVTSRPGTPGSVVTSAAIAAWIAGTVAFGAALIHARGGARAARLAGALSALIVVGVCAFLVYSGMRPRPVALDERERADLERRGEEEAARLVHPHLGLSLPVPEGLRPSTEVAEQARRAAGEEWASAHRVWAWAGEDTEIAVDLARAPRADAAALTEAADAIATDLERTAAGVERRPKGERGAELEAALPGGGTALARVLLFEREGRAYRVVVTIVTRDPSRWNRWLDGITAPAPQ